MTFTQFWDWLFTSRAYRLLLEQNRSLQSEITAVRTENHRLTLALSPALRSLERKPTADTPAPTADAPEKETERHQPRPKGLHTWRNARQQLEFAESSQARRLEQVRQANANLP
jgi:hypothetical protein